MRDTKARFLGFSAIVLACGSYAIGHANADSITEPDAYALQGVVLEQSAQIDELRTNVETLSGTVDDLVNASNEMSETAAAINCLAYSDFHYYKERVNARGRKVRLPVMVWNMSRRECRPASKPWKPSRRSLTPAVSR